MNKNTMPPPKPTLPEEKLSVGGTEPTPSSVSPPPPPPDTAAEAAEAVEAKQRSDSEGPSQSLRVTLQTDPKLKLKTTQRPKSKSLRKLARDAHRGKSSPTVAETPGEIQGRQLGEKSNVQLAGANVQTAGAPPLTATEDVKAADSGSAQDAVAEPAASASTTSTPSMSGKSKHHMRVHHINFHPHARAHDHTGHRRWPQFVCAFFAALCSMTNGSVLGWSSPAVPALEGEPRADDPAQEDAIVTVDEGTWIASIVPLAGIAGSMPSGLMVDTVGRKYVMVSVGVAFFIGWLLIMAGTMRLGVWLLFAGRGLQGVCCGVITAVLPLYLEEISEPAVRGFLGVLFDISTNLGLVMVYTLGIVADQPTMAGVSSIIPALFVLTFSWMPESPLYLVMKGKDEKAGKSLMWLRAGRDPGKEIAEIKRVLRASGRMKTPAPEEEPEEEELPPSDKKRSSLREMAQRHMNRCKRWLRWNDMNRVGWRSVVGRNLFVVFGMMLVRPASGINAITFHTVLIFQRAKTNVLKPNVATLVLAILMLPCGFVSSRLVDRLGRRALLLISLTGVAVCYVIMSVYSLMMDNGAPQWIPVMAMCVIIIFISLGAGPLPWLLMSELTPIRHRIWAAGTAISIQWVGAFAVTKTFKQGLDMGPAYLYAIYVGLAVLSWIFVFFCLPETRGRSRAELQGDTR